SGWKSTSIRRVSCDFAGVCRRKNFENVCRKPGQPFVIGRAAPFRRRAAPFRLVLRQRRGGYMTTDLTYLAWTALLTAALWIPYIYAQVTTGGFLKPEEYRDPTSRQVALPFWGKRADRTHLNAVETFAPFAALVLVAHIAGKANAMTAFW